ncbi:MAG: putative DNA-binding domain-containing protein [Alcanivorax sp.]|nr:putative DNA-binding domain-containing protein [Alcanivorax sp.]
MKAFQEIQHSFAAHMRNPEVNPPPPGMEDRRLAIYRELILNNMDGFLSQGFPVLHSLLSPARWQRLVRAFLQLHRSDTPYFLEVPEQFVRFLSAGQGSEDDDPPFMLELAHYEWMELVLDASQETRPVQGVDPEGDLLDGVPCLSPLQALLCYHYPVHRICEAFQPTQPLDNPVWLVVYRNRDDQVGFMEINQVTARLLQLIDANGEDNGRALVARLGEELNFADTAQLEQFAAETLQHLRDNQILLGCCCPST